MTQRQIIKLRNTIKKQVKNSFKKQLLKQRRPRQNVGQQLQRKLIDKIRYQRQHILSSKSQEMGSNSRQSFPSRKALTIFKNNHTVDKYSTQQSTKIYNYIQKIQQDIDKILLNPLQLFQIAQRQQIRDFESSIKKYTSYLKPEVKNVVHKVNQILSDISDIKGKLQNYSIVQTKYDLQAITLQDILNQDQTVKKYYIQMLQEYNVKNNLKILKQNLFNVADVIQIQKDDKQVLKEKQPQIDYSIIVFKNIENYPQGFVELFKKFNSRLQYICNNIINGSMNKEDLKSMFSDFWFQDSQTIKHRIEEASDIQLTKFGINDQKQRQRIKDIVLNKMIKGE